MQKNMLIAYYSHSGNTEMVAKIIQENTKADIFKIETKKQYPLSYNLMINKVKKELQKGCMPKLKNKISSLNYYNVIYIGTQNWCSNISLPVAEFLLDNDFSNKVIIPFCTHGGGGTGKITCEIKKLCPYSRVENCFGIYASAGSDINLITESIKKWIGEFTYL